LSALTILVIKLVVNTRTTNLLEFGTSSVEIESHRNGGSETSLDHFQFHSTSSTLFHPSLPVALFCYLETMWIRNVSRILRAMRIKELLANQFTSRSRGFKASSTNRSLR